MPSFSLTLLVLTELGQPLIRFVLARVCRCPCAFTYLHHPIGINRASPVPPYHPLRENPEISGKSPLAVCPRANRMGAPGRISKFRRRGLESALPRRCRSFRRRSVHLPILLKKSEFRKV